MSPALAGRFLTAVQPGKSLRPLLVSLFYCPKLLITPIDNLELEQSILLGINWFLNPNEFNKSTESHECTEVAKDPNTMPFVAGFVQI